LIWIVYILQCSDGTLYCGITNNLEERVKKHNSGKGSKYTKTRLPVAVHSSFQVENRSVASKIEWKIKQLSREQKLKLKSIEHMLEKQNDSKINC